MFKSLLTSAAIILVAVTVACGIGKLTQPKDFSLDPKGYAVDMNLTAVMDNPYTAEVETEAIALGYCSGTRLEDGYILTAGHCTDLYIPGATDIQIYADFTIGEISYHIPLELVQVWYGGNKSYDAALYKIMFWADEATPGGLQEVWTGAPIDASVMTEGEKVSAYGFPLNVEGMYSFGYVAQTSGADNDDPDFWTIYTVLGNMTLAPGFSGSGLFDVDGNLIGINVGTFGQSAISIIVPLSEIWPDIEKAIEEDKISEIDKIVFGAFE